MTFQLIIDDLDCEEYFCCMQRTESICTNEESENDEMEKKVCKKVKLKATNKNGYSK